MAVCFTGAGNKTWWRDVRSFGQRNRPYGAQITVDRKLVPPVHITIMISVTETENRLTIFVQKEYRQTAGVHADADRNRDAYSLMQSPTDGWNSKRSHAHANAWTCKEGSTTLLSGKTSRREKKIASVLRRPEWKQKGNQVECFLKNENQMEYIRPS